MFDYLANSHPNLRRALIISFYLLLALLICLIIWSCSRVSSAPTKVIVYAPSVSEEEAALLLVAAQSLAQVMASYSAEVAQGVPNSQMEVNSAVVLGGLTQTQLAELSSYTFIDPTGRISRALGSLGRSATSFTLGNGASSLLTIEELLRDGTLDSHACFSSRLGVMARSMGVTLDQCLGRMLEANQGTCYTAACASSLCIVADPGIFEGGIGATPVAPSPELAGRTWALGMFRVFRPLFEREGMLCGSRLKVMLPGGVFEQAFRLQWADCIKCTSDQCMKENIEIFSCPEIFTQGAKAQGSQCSVMQ